MIQILIADPDITCRDLFSKALGTIAELKILGTCPNGKLCLDRIRMHRPEVVIAAVELGDMGIDRFLSEIKTISPETGVIVVTQPDDPRQADLAVSALASGAFDYLVKPCVRCDEDHIPLLHRLLAPKIWCFTIKRFSAMAKKAPSITVAAEEKIGSCITVPPQTSAPLRTTTPTRKSHYRVILIGVSTGGPEALTRIMPLFPKDMPVPIVIVLHMPKLFTGAMAKDLNAKSAITVHEAKDNDILEAGHAYLAPGGIHMMIESGTRGNLVVRAQDGPPENGCKPAVDVLFRSAAQVVREKAIGIILTGMGVDGTVGVKALKEFNVPIIVQDEATSVVWGMPGNIVKSGISVEVLPLLEIPQGIMTLVNSNG